MRNQVKFIFIVGAGPEVYTPRRQAMGEVMETWRTCKKRGELALQTCKSHVEHVWLHVCVSPTRTILSRPGICVKPACVDRSKLPTLVTSNERPYRAHD